MPRSRKAPAANRSPKSNAKPSVTQIRPPFNGHELNSIRAIIRRHLRLGILFPPSLVAATHIEVRHVLKGRWLDPDRREFLERLREWLEADYRAALDLVEAVKAAPVVQGGAR